MIDSTRTFINSVLNTIKAPIKACIRWKHIATSMIGVPVLELFGIHWKNGMRDRVFEEKSCFFEGRKIGQLKYEMQKNGYEVPVLELSSEDEYEMGYCQGYLLGKEIDRLFNLVLKPMIALAQVATGDFRGNFFRKQIEVITIPEEYRKEINGLVKGIHQYAKDYDVPIALTEELVLNAHKLTDIYKSILCQKIFGIAFFNSMGCSTAVVKKGVQTGVCRTLDWPSMGMMGKYTLLRRHTHCGMGVEMQTFPGIIGALTAFNEKGLVAIINEVGTVSKEGVPYNLLTRKIIDSAANVNEAKAMIDDPTYIAASSHHLTLADASHAINFQMHVLEDCKYVARELGYDEQNKYLVVTNHAFDHHGVMIDKSNADSSSLKRFSLMQKNLEIELSQEQDITSVMKKALKSVNVKDTVSAAVYTFSEQGQVLPQEYVCDDYFAAEHLIT